METTGHAMGDYVAKPLDVEKCHASIRPPHTRLVFQCNMPRGYGPHRKFCQHHAERKEAEDANTATNE